MVNSSASPDWARLDKVLNWLVDERPIRSRSGLASGGAWSACRGSCGGGRPTLSPITLSDRVRTMDVGRTVEARSREGGVGDVGSLSLMESFPMSTEWPRS